MRVQGRCGGPEAIATGTMAAARLETQHFRRIICRRVHACYASSQFHEVTP
jgi:hypothetical protein